MLLGSKVCFQNINMHSSAKIRIISALKNLFNKMCVFGKGGLKLLFQAAV